MCLKLYALPDGAYAAMSPIPAAFFVAAGILMSTGTRSTDAHGGEDAQAPSERNEEGNTTAQARIAIWDSMIRHFTPIGVHDPEARTPRIDPTTLREGEE